MSLRPVGLTRVPPGPKPGFDHADTYLDPAGSRIYVAHTGANRVDVLDCGTGRHLHSLDGLPGVAGVLIDTDHDLLFTSDRAAARVSMFRPSNDGLVTRVAVGDRPNGLAYDSRRRTLFTFNLGEPPGTGCTASVVSVDERRVIETIALPGRPRWAVFDDARRAVYANIAEPAVIAVIDADALAIRACLAVPAGGPHGLALVDDEDRASLWCAADAGELVVLDLDGGVRARLRLPGAPDVVMHSAALSLLYVAIGAPGVVASYDTKGLAPIETVATEEGAHTIGWDPLSRRLFVFLPRSCAVAVYRETG